MFCGRKSGGRKAGGRETRQARQARRAAIRLTAPRAGGIIRADITITDTVYGTNNIFARDAP